MTMNKRLNAGRRKALAKIAAGGALGAGGLMGAIATALAQETRQGITHLKGNVKVDGKPAVLGQFIRAGQKVTTGFDSEVVFILNKDAFLVRENSELEIEGKIVVSALRFITGKVLSVFGRGGKQLRTPTATIGIRGTGCYIEADPENTYFCLCYGEAELTPLADPAAKEIIRTRYHERPLMIGSKRGETMMAKGAVKGHTDAELTMLESLVGRKPPFYGTSHTGY